MIEDPRYPALIGAVRQAQSQAELSAALAAALDTFIAEAEAIGPTGSAFYSNMISIAHSRAAEHIRNLEREKRA